jgi:beta-glucanase (GH16 family)
MRKIFRKITAAVILQLSLVSGAQTPSTSQSSYFTAIASWEDNFDNNTGTGQLPQTTHWRNEKGFIRNLEEQYYTDRIENQVITTEGKLNIIGIKERYISDTRELADVTSASLVSNKEKGFKYGKITGAIKVDEVNGVWACFWTLGTNGAVWPKNGEIDIVERVNASDKWHATLHYWDELTNVKVQDGGAQIYPLTTDPIKYVKNMEHTYTIEWTPRDIRWYLDGGTTPVKTVSILNGVMGSWEFHTAHNILLNCPIGGEFPLSEGYVRGTGPARNIMEVDYVRVYDYVSPNPAPPTDLNTASTSIAETSFILTCSPPTSTTRYFVFLENKGTVIRRGPFTGNSNSIQGLTPGTTYTVRAKCINATTGDSDLSVWSDLIYVNTRYPQNSTIAPLVNLSFNNIVSPRTTTAELVTVPNSGLTSIQFNTRTRSVANVFLSNVPANTDTSAAAPGQSFDTKNGVNIIVTKTPVDELIGLQEFTITGWLNCSNTQLPINARYPNNNKKGRSILNNFYQQWEDARQTDGFDLLVKEDGNLQLTVNQLIQGTNNIPNFIQPATTPTSSAGKITVASTMPQTNWKFFAVTYSAYDNATTGNVKFYFGDSNTNASEDMGSSIKVYNKGPLGLKTGKLTIGQISTGNIDTAFNGLIDQIKIFPTKLTLQQIIAAQSRNTSTTPIVTNPNEYQAEEGSLLNGCTIRTNISDVNSPVNGIYFDLLPSGDPFNKINLRNNPTGMTNITIRYKNSDTSSKQLSLYLYNKSDAPVFHSKVTFIPTGRTAFGTVRVSNIDFSSRNNVFKLQSDSGDTSSSLEIDKYIVGVLPNGARMKLTDAIEDTVQNTDRTQLFETPTDSDLSIGGKKQILVIQNSGNIELNLSGYNLSEFIDVSIYNVNGQLVFSKKSSEVNRMFIDKQFNDGVYILKVTDNGNATFTKKIIVKN